MSATDTCTTPANPTLGDELRAAFNDADLIGMVYAESFAARRDNLPHHGNTACGLGRAVPGCDGLCSTAIVLIIEDLIGFYRRQLDRGQIGRLDNPGGYARTIIRRRHLDVVRALTRPEGGYARPERIADLSKAPAYLGLSDDIDARLVSATMFYLRSETTTTTWQRVCDNAHATCTRHGLTLADGEARVRLDGFIDRALAAGGRAEEFVRREILDLLDARQTTVTDELADNLASIRTLEHDRTDAALDEHAITSLLDNLDAHLDQHGGWGTAPHSARREAVTLLIDLPSDSDVDGYIDLIDTVRTRRG